MSKTGMTDTDWMHSEIISMHSCVCHYKPYHERRLNVDSQDFNRTPIYINILMF